MAQRKLGGLSFASSMEDDGRLARKSLETQLDEAADDER